MSHLLRRAALACLLAVAFPTLAPGQAADLSVAKLGPFFEVTASQSFGYGITVTNHGPQNAQNVTLTDVLPANTTFLFLIAPAGWTIVAPPAGSAGTVTATIPVLTPAAGAQTLSLFVNVDPFTPHGSTITNTATVASATSDPSSANDSATETTTVRNVTELAVTVSDDPDPVVAGGTLTYTITVRNNLFPPPHPAPNVTLTSVLPPFTTFVSFATPAGWTPTTPPVGGTGTVTATRPLLADIVPHVFTLVVAVDAVVPQATIASTATITTSEPEQTPEDNADTETTSIAAPLPAAPQIPTLSGWGLLALLVAIGGSGLALLRR